MLKFPKKVLISGQTHGNEWTGRYVAKHLMSMDLRDSFPNLEVKIILSNPKAFEINRRYVDQDLNRSFALRPEAVNYETARAKSIRDEYNLFAQEDDVFIIDLHTTTSNMGSSLVLHNTDSLNISVFSYIKNELLKKENEPVNAYAWLEKKDLNFLNSLSPYGFAIELGPIAQGTICPKVFKKTWDLLMSSLEFLNDPENGKKTINKEEEIFIHKQSVDYPREGDGDLSAMLSPNMLDMNFVPLKKDTPIFEKFNFEKVMLPELAGLTPVFINEAAYYEKSIAFSVCEKSLINTVI